MIVVKSEKCPFALNFLKSLYSLILKCVPPVGVRLELGKSGGNMKMEYTGDFNLKYSLFLKIG